MLALACPAAAQEAPVQQQGQPQQGGQGQSSREQNGRSDRNQPRVEIDTHLICDTAQQVERFVSLLDENGGSAENAIAAVNKESKTPDACVIATAAYMRTGVASSVKNREATFDVARIVVLGVYTVNGLERSLPTEFFALVPRAGEDGTVGQGSQDEQGGQGEK
jgi:hypothetical protein